MPGKDFSISAKQVQDYLDDHFPGAIAETRTDTNSECVAFYPETGHVIERAGSNKKLIAKMTDPDFVPEYKRPGRLLDVPPTVDIKSRAQNLTNKILGAINELGQISKKKPIVKYDKDGRAVAIKTGDIIYKKR